MGSQFEQDHFLTVQIRCHLFLTAPPNSIFGHSRLARNLRILAEGAPQKNHVLAEGAIRIFDWDPKDIHHHRVWA